MTIATSHLQMPLTTLQHMLDLPPTVRILAVREDPSDVTQVLLELGGTGVPSGPVYAVYGGEQHTVIKFKRFVVAGGR